MFYQAQTTARDAACLLQQYAILRNADACQRSLGSSLCGPSPSTRGPVVISKKQIESHSFDQWVVDSLLLVPRHWSGASPKVDKDESYLSEVFG